MKNRQKRFTCTKCLEVWVNGRPTMHGDTTSLHGNTHCICECHPCTVKSSPVEDKEEGWEEQAQKFMDRLSMFDLEILNTIVYHKRQDARREVAEEIYEKLFKAWDARYYTDDNVDQESVRIILVALKEKYLSKEGGTE